MKVSGLTCIQTYVEWSSHEPAPGRVLFNGNLDLEHFLDIAAEIGLGKEDSL